MWKFQIEYTWDTIMSLPLRIHHMFGQLTLPKNDHEGKENLDEIEERIIGIISGHFISSQNDFPLNETNSTLGCDDCFSAGKCNAPYIGIAVAFSQCECQSMCAALPGCNFFEWSQQELLSR